jgi:hypothetical protein
MSSLKICNEIIGWTRPQAEELIQLEGCTARVTYENGKILLDNITSDYNEQRINLRVDRGIVKHARIG